MESQAHQDQREKQAQTEPQAKTVSQVRQAHQEAAEHKERREFARNTAPWTAVSSSRMELDAKQSVVKEDSSQASQRNAVFLLLFYVPFLFTHNDVNLKL
jgi:hypothetical protein